MTALTSASCGPSGRAPAHPASRRSPPSSRSTSPAEATPWARQSSKRSCRRTTAPPRPSRSRCPTDGLEERDGVEAKAVVLEQLARALEVVRRHDPARIATFGGECSASVAPFSELARRYGEDLAIVWIDAHPDVGTPQSEYPGYHAMAVATLTGHGDPDAQDLLPAIVSPNRVALVGLHSWDEDDFPNIIEWGIQSYSSDELRGSSQPLLDWLAATGCSRAAIHFDVDAVDSNEIVLGLGMEPGGLTSAEVRRIIADIDGAVDIVGFTIAEFIPRQVMHLRRILDGFPLIYGTTAD